MDDDTANHHTFPEATVSSKRQSGQSPAAHSRSQSLDPSSFIGESSTVVHSSLGRFPPPSPRLSSGVSEDLRESMSSFGASSSYDELKYAKRRCTELTQTVDELSEQKACLESVTSQLQSILSARTDDLRESRSQSRHLDRSNSELSVKIETLTVEAQRDKSERIRANNSLLQESQVRQQAVLSLEELRTKHASLLRQLRSKDLEIIRLKDTIESLNEVKRGNSDLEEVVTSLKDELSSAQDENGQLRLQVQQLREQTEELVESASMNRYDRSETRSVLKDELCVVSCRCQAERRDQSTQTQNPEEAGILSTILYSAFALVFGGIALIVRRTKK
eukprot:96479_1